ncbi:MFS transporter [Rahnella sp. WP5]|uniref:MFS transporter n=1 Tax=Rahnella sp. WP5 TaxID=1500266 RepID=UPI0005659C79|nr:MFS transporter [Rahnella sp. WP5]
MKISPKNYNYNANTRLLSLTYGFFICAISVDLTITALAGFYLSEYKALSTLPFALITASGAISALLIPPLINRFGTKNIFMTGCLIGIVGSLVSALSIYQHSFILLCIGASLVGVYQSVCQFYRLCAADFNPEGKKGSATSMVLAGGVVAAIVGPLLASEGENLITSLPFAGAYIFVSCLCVISFISLAIFYDDYRYPKNLEPKLKLLHLDVRLLAKRPFLNSSLNLSVGSFLMLFIMTAAPLAMMTISDRMSHNAFMIQLHLLGMYVPSLFTGLLIRKIGTQNLALTGTTLTIISFLCNLFMNDIMSLYVSLLLLGIGWNFMFVSGTVLLTHSYDDSNRESSQSLSEFLRIIFSAISSLTAGWVFETSGWMSMNIVCLIISVPILFFNIYITIRMKKRVIEI